MNENSEQSDTDNVTVKIGLIEKPNFVALGNIEEKGRKNGNKHQNKQSSSRSPPNPNETTVPLITSQFSIEKRGSASFHLVKFFGLKEKPFRSRSQKN